MVYVAYDNGGQRRQEPSSPQLSAWHTCWRQQQQVCLVRLLSLVIACPSLPTAASAASSMYAKLRIGGWMALAALAAMLMSALMAKAVVAVVSP